MKPFYNTPQLHNSPAPVPPQKTGKELIYQLEDRIENYLDDCNKGYCRLDKKALEELRTELRQARVAEVNPFTGNTFDPIIEGGNV